MTGTFPDTIMNLTVFAFIALLVWVYVRK